VRLVRLVVGSVSGSGSGEENGSGGSGGSGVDGVVDGGGGGGGGACGQCPLWSPHPPKKSTIKLIILSKKVIVLKK
jgi:hypothetical protein